MCRCVCGCVYVSMCYGCALICIGVFVCAHVCVGVLICVGVYVHIGVEVRG